MIASERWSPSAGKIAAFVGTPVYYWFGRASLISNSRLWAGRLGKGPIAGEELVAWHIMAAATFGVVFLAALLLAWLGDRKVRIGWPLIISYYLTVSACFVAIPGNM
jgi:hypothetical protein